MRKFKALESLRFFAAISVALLHIFGVYGKGNLIPYSFILSVDFFFVLSGFVVTYKESKNKNSLDYTKEFVYGRVIRLLIPYMLIILFYYLFFNKFFLKRHITLLQGFIEFFLLQIMGLNINNIADLNILDTGLVAWAVGLELYIGSFYFPFVHYIKKKSKVLLFLFCIAIFIVSLSIITHNSDRFLDVHYQEWHGIPLGIFRILISYSIGTVSALIYNKIKEIELKYNENLIYSSLEIIIILVLFRYYGKVDYYRENEYLFPVIAGLMIMIFAQEKGILSNFLKKIYYLGLLSYSIYLLHPIYIGVFRYFNMKLDIFLIIIYLVCIILGSCLFYKNIEKFIIKFKYDTRK
jgi:putative acyltransferase